MIYYLKKFWRQNLLVLLIQVVMYGLISWQALVQIQLFQALIDWEFRRFLLVEALNVGIWLAVPRMFHKRMERLGEVCAQEQAAASGKLKELLGGFDVLCFFRRKDRFLRGIEQASDSDRSAQVPAGLHPAGGFR